MSKIRNGGLDQYGAGPFEQQLFGTVGIEGVNFPTYLRGVTRQLWKYIVSQFTAHRAC